MTARSPLPDAIEVVPAGPLVARLRAPASKSITNRALVVAALAEGESIVRDPLESDDTHRMTEGLRALGAGIEHAQGGWTVRGTGGALRAPGDPIDCGLSGTTLRFLAAVAALAPGEVRLTGRPGLLRRPIEPLLRALESFGAAARADGHGLSVEGGRKLRGGEHRVDAASSSQFATALLLIAPYVGDAVVLHVENLSAPGYAEMTVRLMEQWGVRAPRVAESTWHIPATAAPYRAREYTVEYDASAAAHLFALAMTTGGQMTVENADPATLQPDARIVEVFAAMGASVAREGSALTVRAPEHLRAVATDLSSMPDQLPTLAAVAALSEGTSAVTGVGVAREHETDRLAAVAAELRKAGIAVDEHPDSVVIAGDLRAARAARIATYDDHRMAMAFGAFAARVPGTVIENPGCVAKTYPGFWDDCRSAGLRWRPAG